MARYYANITGAANVSVPFNPYQVYTGNGNYIRLEVNCDNLRTDGTKNNGAVWLNGTSQWFSFEMYGQGWEYLNLGGTTYIGRYEYWSTNGFEETFVVEMNNGNVTLTKGEQTSATTFSGNFNSANISFFPTRTGANTRVNFYEWKAYGANNTLLFDFVPDYSGTTMGLRDKVSENFYAATDQTKIELIALSIFETDVTEINSTYTGLTTSVTLTTDENISWTATTIPSFVTLSSTAGTNTTQITVSIAFNSTYSERSGSIIFTSSEGDTAEITVSQAKHPVLIPNNNIYRGGNRIN